jgi:anhydro-N-acetylmuramic acid kinase
VTRGLFVGAISGTSVDGLDLALLEIDDLNLRILAGHTAPLPDGLRSQLLRLGRTGEDDLDAYGAADVALGRFIGDEVLRFLASQGIDPKAVTAIGSHGQTVRHRPTGPVPFTLQIGDPNTIAELTGIDTVADFRRRDMAADGQGAPLVPPFHQALFGSSTEDRAVLNIGGIANLTLLPAGAARPVTGFDTGPGNGLMDAWTAEHLDTPFDADGAWGDTGTVDRALLDVLLADPFFDAAPPKSTGREYFNLAWLRQRLGAKTRRAEDVQATLRALTATAIAAGLSRWCPVAREVIVCGGGRRNHALMEELRERTGRPVQPAEAYGADGDIIEAAAFAWLAWRTVNGLPGNEAAVTGARGPRVLGAIYRA